ncbi:MAG: hypothetical protein J7L55_03475 [Desulfurococcales archaeon]|nr:hypothetical protein [Desulfurococcales archaeon]
MSQKGSGKSTGKELRIVSKKVISEDAVKKDLKKMKVLKIIESFKQISERSLSKLLYMLKEEKGIDVGYKFLMLGETPTSRGLAEDIRILLYLGLVETDPITRRLRLTSNGLEFLEKNPPQAEDLDELMQAVEEFKPKIEAEESAAELALGYRRRRRRFRR